MSALLMSTVLSIATCRCLSPMNYEVKVTVTSFNTSHVPVLHYLKNASLDYSTVPISDRSVCLCNIMRRECGSNK
jgi:hypothetical protein